MEIEPCVLSNMCNDQLLAYLCLAASVSSISLYTRTHLDYFPILISQYSYSLPFLNFLQHLIVSSVQSKDSLAQSQNSLLPRDPITSVLSYTVILRIFHSILESCFPQKALVGFVIAAFDLIACLCWSS